GRYLQPGYHTPIGSPMVAVVEHRDIPAPAQVVEEIEQRPRSLGKLEAEHYLVAHTRCMATDHMTDVQLGQFIIGEVEYRKALFLQARDQRLARVVFRVRLHADEDVCLTVLVVTVVELGDLSLADRLAEGLAAARLLG